MQHPSIKQMAARANSAHRAILAALVDGTPLPVFSTSDARGISTAKATLMRWGCVESVRESHAAPPIAVATRRGEALLSFLRSRGEAHGAASDDSGKSTPSNRNPDSRPCANESTYWDAGQRSLESATARLVEQVEE